MNRIFAALLAVLFAAAIFTCEELQTPLDGDQNGDDTGSDLTVQEYVDSANASFGQLMGTLSQVDDPTTADFSGLADVNQLYVNALELDPTHAQANFGAAVTHLLLILEDGSVFMNELERWEAFLDTTNIFGEPITQNTVGKVNPDQNTLLARNPLSVESLGKVSGTSYLEAILGLPKYAQDYPEFSDWQDLIESTVLGRIDSALSMLNVVEQDQEFVFPITPEMQGNPDADTLEIDLTEVYLFDGALQAVQALCNIAIAYDVNLSPYNETAITDRLNQETGSFMTLRKPGSMSAALDGITGILDKAESALNFLEAESDDQTNDVLPQPSQGTEEGQDPYGEVQGAIDTLRLVLSGPVTITDEDINEDGIIDHQDEITIDLSKLFTPEIEDFKQILPSYGVEVGSDIEYEYIENSVEEDSIENGAYAEVEFPEQGFYQFSYGIHWDSWEGKDVWDSEDEGNFIWIQAFRDSVWSKFEHIKSDLYAEYGQNLAYVAVYVHLWEDIPEPGVYEVTRHIYFDYGLQQPVYQHIYPSLYWKTETFANWLADWDNTLETDTSPNSDPTFNGIFPDLTSGEAFAAKFGITAEDFWHALQPPK